MTLSCYAKTTGFHYFVGPVFRVHSSLSNNANRKSPNDIETNICNTFLRPSHDQSPHLRWE